MNQTPRATFQLTEDWLATLAGLIAVAVIGLGLLGPGPQSVAFTVNTGETVAKSARPVAGWSASATLGDAKVKVNDLPAKFEAGQSYLITCANDMLSAAALEALPEGVSAPATDRAQIVVHSECAAPLKLSLTTPAAIPYPIFKLF